MTIRKTIAAALLFGAIAAAGFILNAQEAAKTASKPVAAKDDKLEQEYKQMRKQEYLKNLDERAKYYTAMAAETKAIRKACAGEDKDACKKARDHAKATREKLTEVRKANNEQFKNKVDQYRTKMGKAAPNDAEKDSKELQDKPE